MSKGQLADGRLGQSFHALTFVVPLYRFSAVLGNSLREKNIVFTFNFPDRQELGSRQRLDLSWVIDGPPASRCLIFPSDYDSLVQQVLDVGKEVNWQGSTHKVMLWQRYIMTYERRIEQSSN